jgi:hypothetical protein
MGDMDLGELPLEQSRLLSWFRERTGTVTRYPDQLDNGAFLVSRPKGIYKPAGWDHALSIRSNLDSPYKDGEITYRSDNTWFFSYHQEGTDLQQPESEYTNRALLRCIEDRVPVGVLREVEVPKGQPVQYQVVGLAVPTKWHAGYFYFEGSSPSVTEGTSPNIEVADGSEGSTSGSAEDFQDYDDTLDARVRTLRAIAARQGQASFRRALLGVYSSTCSVTGTRVEAVLEAAHLRPYRGNHTNILSNGLLLRADIHTLMDLQHIAINPESRTVALSPQLLASEYRVLQGRPVSEPVDSSARPATASLHWVWTSFLAGL